MDCMTGKEKKAVVTSLCLSLAVLPHHPVMHNPLYAFGFSGLSSNYRTYEIYVTCFPYSCHPWSCQVKHFGMVCLKRHCL